MFTYHDIAVAGPFYWVASHTGRVFAGLHATLNLTARFRRAASSAHGGATLKF